MNTVADITRLYEAEQASGRVATTAADIPISYDLISPKWFTAVLCGKHPGAEVTAYRLGDLDNGSSNRRRIFLTYNDAGNAAGLPKAVFAKASHGLANRVTLGTVGAIHSEVRFYKFFRPMVTVEAPQGLFANIDLKTWNSIILLRDIADDVTFCNHDTPMTFARAEDQLHLLATLHARFFESPDLGKPPLDAQTWPQHWRGMCAIGMEEYSNKGFRNAEDVIPPRLFKRYDEIWPATMRAVALHDLPPRTYCHGDVHLRNWYITKDGRMGLCDWQANHIGHWARDVAYCLTCAITVEDRRKWEQDLIKSYLHKRQSLGVPVISFDEALKSYRRQLFPALAYWTVTFTPSPAMPDMQPSQSSIEFIKRMAHAIDDHDALDSF